jgi:hypothetical protein
MMEGVDLLWYRTAIRINTLGLQKKTWIKTTITVYTNIRDW